MSANQRPFPFVLTSLLGATVLLTGALPAQARMRYSWDGNTPASGTGPGGGPSTCTVFTGGQGYHTFSYGAGQSTNQAATSAQQTLAAAGFNATMVAPNAICISTGPQGALAGGGLVCQDTGIEGIDCGWEAVDGPGGVLVPKLPPSEPQAQGPGSVQLEITIKFANGSFELRIVKTFVFPGDTPNQVENRRRLDLQQAGFLVMDARFRDLRTPGALLDGYCISHTVDGARLTHVAYKPVVPGQRFVKQLILGVFPEYGSCNYGNAYTGSTTLSPVIHARTAPRLGQPLVVETTLGSPFGLLLIGTQPAALPLFALGVPAYAACDPATGLVELCFANPQGVGQYALFVPPMPTLVGMSLYWQSIDFPTSTLAGMRLSDGLRTTIW